MKNILFLIQNLEGGGAERVVVNIINNLSVSKYKKELILIENKGILIEDLTSDLEKIVFKNFFSNRNVNFLLNLLKTIMIILKKRYDVIFTQYHPAKVLSFFIPLLSKKTKFIYRETNLPQEIKKISKSNIKILDLFFYRYGIKNYSRIIVQSLDMKEKLVKLVPNIEEKVILINNPIDLENIDKKLQKNFLKKEKGKLQLISLGRLNKQKGYDLLIETLSKIKNIDFDLKILGVGEEKENLLNLIRKRNLETKVHLLGYKKNPYLYLKNSDFFISSSIFEGFPNAVLEANYCGIPVIANNYKGGINEIIISNLNGEIIDIRDEKALENSLKKKYNSEKIKENIKKRFGVNSIIKKYEKIF